MSASQKDTQFEQLVHKIAPHSTLLRTWSLQGGVSAQMTVLEIEQPDGQTQKLIVRQHGAADLSQNPQIAADEFRLLHHLQDYGLPTPKPYHLDQSGQILPTPYIVIEHLEGTSAGAPAEIPNLIQQLAVQLSKIHAINGDQAALSFLPRQEQRYSAMLQKRPTTVDASFDEGRIRDTLEAVWPLPPRNRSVLLHGDYWPGNILWHQGELSGVIDWEDAAIGNPLADIANSRLEILWAFGLDAMIEFTQQYRTLAPIDVTQLPYWELCAALRSTPKISHWGLDDQTEQAMHESARWFIDQAFNKLAG